MLCPKCKIEARNSRAENGDWVAKCHNPQCSDYGKTIQVILPKKKAEEQ